MMRSKESKMEPVALNGGQKNVIEGTLRFIFDDLEKLMPLLTIKALQAMSEVKVSDSDKKLFIENEIWASIEFVHKILDHKYPENRTTENDAYDEVVAPGLIVYRIADNQFDKLIQRKNSSSDFVYFKNGRAVDKENIIDFDPDNKEFVASEPEGLLSLTALEDPLTPPVTKDSVIKYIFHLIQKEIEFVQERIEEKKSTPQFLSPSDENTTSLIDPLKNISMQQWVVCLAIDKKTNKSKIYLEGMHSNKEIFLNCYALDNGFGYSLVKVDAIRPLKFDCESFHLYTYTVDPISAMTLKNYIKEDFTNYNGKSCVSQCSGLTTFSRDDRSLDWVIQTLKKININIDKKSIIRAPEENSFNCTKSIFTCSIQ